MMQLNKKNWKEYSFGDVAIQQKETVNRQNTTLGKYVAGEHMTTEDIHIRQWGIVGADYLGPAFYRKFCKDDILYGSRRTYLKKVAVAHFDGITANTTFVIRSNDEIITPRILPFLMLSDSFTDHSVKNSKGSVNPYINWKDIANYKFKLPPLDEQKCLADLLWSVDDVIESYVNLWEEIDILRKIYTKNLIENKTYPMKKINEVAIVASGNSAPQGDKYFNGDKPFVRVQHFSESDLLVNTFDLINDLAIKDYNLKLFPKNSIVFTKSGASAYLEKKAMLKKPSYVVSHLGVLIPDEAEIMPNYLFYVFKGLNISRNCVSDYPTIDLTDIKRWVIPVPDKKNQQTLVCEFDEMIKNQQAVKKAQVDLTEIKKQIINQIFRGKP